MEYVIEATRSDEDKIFDEIRELRSPLLLFLCRVELHALPEPLGAAPMDAAPVVAETPESAISGRAADAAFMDLMSRVRRDTSAAREPLTISTTPPASQTRSEPVINDEFDKLLGSTRTKG